MPVPERLAPPPSHQGSFASIMFTMPELPEIETIRRTLAKSFIGARITGAELRCAKYVRGDGTPKALLCGATIARLDRHGKQLAIVATDGRLACIHLGMSGQLLVGAAGTCDRPESGSPETSHWDGRLVRHVPRWDGRLFRKDQPLMTHIHLRWRFVDVRGADRFLTLRDPRRFGGVWTFPAVEQLLRQRWSQLGPDALTITSGDLRRGFECSRRAVKSALLDQSVLAGLGNIYTDESLFRAGIHPVAPAGTLRPARLARLADAIRETLLRAIAARGTTRRDYRDADGQSGNYFSERLVYGRAGENCSKCARTLKTAVVAHRTTVWCSRCQR